MREITDDGRASTTKARRQFVRRMTAGGELERNRRNDRTGQRAAADPRLALHETRSKRQTPQSFDQFFSAFPQLADWNLEQGENRKLSPIIAQVCFDCRGQSRENELVATERTEKRLAFEGNDETRFSGDDSSLRTAEQFVAAETDEIDSLLQGFAGRRFVICEAEFFRCHDRATPEILDERNSFGPRQRRDLLGGRGAGETADEEIALMHLQDQGGFGTNRFCIIVEGGFVGRADFPQPRAARFQNFADPESTADLDQFASGNDHFRFSPGKMAHDQDEGGRAVVNDDGCLAPASEGESASR